MSEEKNFVEKRFEETKEKVRIMHEMFIKEIGEEFNHLEKKVNQQLQELKST
ncbi:MAG: hypothetical protein L6N96_01785 [Candidatus Methylarchaceae archaeon HK02M2]|nr:hypothetical protein [Candidatus Methylarchaceae archaeon HK02M2]